MAVGESSSPADPGGGSTQSEGTAPTTPDTGASGLRRRHSGATEDEQLGQTGSAPAPYEVEAPGVGRRKSTGSASTHRRQKSLSSAVDYEGVVEPEEEQEKRLSRDSQGDTPKVVRFSTEVQRDQQAPLRSGSESGTAASRHATGLGLSVITSNDADTVLGEGTVQSPSTTSAQPGDPQRSGSFPLSPKTRSRGWSLRRTLLNRNLDGPDTRASTAAHAARNSIVELDEVSPNPGSSRPQPFDGITSPHDSSNSSKKSDHIVIVSPGIDQHPDTDHHSDSTFPDRQTLKKGLQGISALPHYESWIRDRARRNAYINRVRAGYQKLRKMILRIQEIPPSKDGRHIPLDASRKKALTDERTGRPYVENWIRSSRYSAWNFVPRQLFAQFSKLANFYFLVVSILQMIPSKSLLSGSANLR